MHDVMFYTNNAKELRGKLKPLKNKGNKFSLKINLKKGMVQKISRDHDVSCMNLKGRQFKEEFTFSYLAV